MNKIKGSYFPNEVYDYESSTDKLLLFVEMLKSRGSYIDENWHIRSKKGGLMSKLMRNGYYMTQSQYNKKIYYFMEHRVIWVWFNGSIPDGLVINHKDFVKSNNNIENLELTTPKENVEYSRCNFKPCKGEKGRKAVCTNEQAKTIRAIASMCGLSPSCIENITGLKRHNITRIIRGERYKDIVSANSILEVYPTFVEYTMNKKLSKDEQLKNYCLGLSGEVGELNDIMKKIFYHGKEFDPVDIALELGDILYYLTAICILLEIDISEIMLNNNAKLLNRYKNGYNVNDSLNRIENNNDGSTSK